MLIIGHIFSCVLWGVVTAIALTALALYIVKAVNPSRMITPAGWCAALIMAAFVGFHSTLMVGAIKAKGMVADLEEAISSFAGETGEFDDTSSVPANIGDEFNSLKKKYPFIERIVDIDKMPTADYHDYAESVGKEALSYLNWYIVRRIGWSVLSMFLGALTIASLSQTPGHRRACKGDYRGQRDTYK